MEDPSLPTTTWPERKVLFTFTHPTAGDEHFTTMIAQAMRDLMASDPRGKFDRFIARNGVQIDVTWPAFSEKA